MFKSRKAFYEIWSSILALQPGPIITSFKNFSIESLCSSRQCFACGVTLFGFFVLFVLLLLVFLCKFVFIFHMKCLTVGKSLNTSHMIFTLFVDYFYITLFCVKQTLKLVAVAGVVKYLKILLFNDHLTHHYCSPFFKHSTMI